MGKQSEVAELTTFTQPVYKTESIMWNFAMKIVCKYVSIKGDRPPELSVKGSVLLLLPLLVDVDQLYLIFEK